MPTISVIVPVYMVECYLPMCIESILSQSFSDFELILVDDGSLDNCGVICDEYATKDRRIRVIHKVNGGVSQARNAALEVAIGKYVTFCDSDDFYKRDWLENLVLAAQRQHSDLVIGNYLRVTDDNMDLSKTNQETGSYPVDSPQEKVTYILNYVFGQKHGWEACTKLFQLDIIQHHNIRYCESCGDFAEDLGFVLEYLLYAKQVLSIESSGYCYRIRKGSMMHISKNVVRLDSVNEVGLRFINASKCVFPKDMHYVLPIFYFLIMYNQYSKIIGTDRYPYLKDELHKMQKYKQWKKNTKAIFRCKKQLYLYLGKVKASWILIFCRYCMHGCWKIFSLESILFYRKHPVEKRLII